MQQLTERQNKVYSFISERIFEYGCPPTLREISKCIGTKGTATAILHLEALERKGYIQRRGGSRGIVVANKAAIPISLPIVGTVRAGQPELATEDIQGYYSIDPSWVKGEGCYFLKVKGDSMVEAGILNGDLAIIRPQPTAENGQIVVALINGEATLKRFFKEKDHIRLQPENSSMEPIIIRKGASETIILGRLLKIIRDFI